MSKPERHAWRTRGASAPHEPLTGKVLSARAGLEVLRSSGRIEEATQLEAAMRAGDLERARSMLAPLTEPAPTLCEATNSDDGGLDAQRTEAHAR